MIKHLPEVVVNRVCKEHGIELIDIQYWRSPKGETYWEASGTEESSYDGNCYVIGRDQILVGIFSDPELRLLAILHEIGHCLDETNTRSKFSQELSAWRFAIDFAAGYGIQFSPEALRWALGKLETYANSESAGIF